VAGRLGDRRTPSDAARELSDPGLGGSSPQMALPARFAEADPPRLLPANGAPTLALSVER
jgi:hypothetical protein